MNANPPSRAKALAIVSLDTDCIHALTSGILIDNGASSPFLNLHKGVLSETLDGTQFSDE